MKQIRNIENQKNKLRPLIICTLLTALFLTISTLGCGNLLIRETKYVAPELPKSEVATIQIDTDGQWFQRTKLFVLRINGKVAVRKEIGKNKKITFDDVLVVPGKHNMSIQFIMESYGVSTPQDRHFKYNLSTEVKSGGTYLLKGEYYYSSGAEYSFELINSANDKLVSKSRLLSNSTFKVEKNKKSSGFKVKLSK